MTQQRLLSASLGDLAQCVMDLIKLLARVARGFDGVLVSVPPLKFLHYAEIRM